MIKQEVHDGPQSDCCKPALSCDRVLWLVQSPVASELSWVTEHVRHLFSIGASYQCTVSHLSSSSYTPFSLVFPTTHSLILDSNVLRRTAFPLTPSKSRCESHSQHLYESELIQIHLPPWRGLFPNKVPVLAGGGPRGMLPLPPGGTPPGRTLGGTPPGLTPPAGLGFMGLCCMLGFPIGLPMLLFMGC